MLWYLSYLFRSQRGIELIFFPKIRSSISALSLQLHSGIKLTGYRRVFKGSWILIFLHQSARALFEVLWIDPHHCSRFFNCPSWHGNLDPFPYLDSLQDTKCLRQKKKFYFSGYEGQLNKYPKLEDSSQLQAFSSCVPIFDNHQYPLQRLRGSELWPK